MGVLRGRRDALRAKTQRFLTPFLLLANYPARFELAAAGKLGMRVNVD